MPTLELQGHRGLGAVHSLSGQQQHHSARFRQQHLLRVPARLRCHQRAQLHWYKRSTKRLRARLVLLTSAKYTVYTRALCVFLPLGCAMGSYKGSSANTGCTTCPALTTTASAASVSKLQCLCLPGATGPNGGACLRTLCRTQP